MPPHWLDVQRESSSRLGVAGDWLRRYATMDFASEAAIAGEIGKFLMNGSLYRGLRPVMWSPVEKTALAEAEIEYHDHISPTLWARFPVAAPGDLVGASVVIWTTTPWTIPGNRAVAYGPEIDYALVHVEGVGEGSQLVPGERLLIALPLLPQCREGCRLGDAYASSACSRAPNWPAPWRAHPLRGARAMISTCPLLPGDFVTTEAGTGFVHIAPGHGEDDFDLGRAHGLPVPETVNDDGTFTHWAPGFAGLHVFKAHDAGLRRADRARPGLLAAEHGCAQLSACWRSKAPVIFRATPQWFIAHGRCQPDPRQGAGGDRRHALRPGPGRNRIGSMVAARPDWCISRQRAWGVPIAVFVDRRTGEPLRDPEVVERIVAAFAAEGADAWYQPSPPARFLGHERDPADYEQVMDIVDVWFESGSTHAFVLEARGMPWPADLYLEGSDQHRGWFHSSLLEASAPAAARPSRRC